MMNNLKRPWRGKFEGSNPLVPCQPQARGRNRWFQPAQFQVLPIPDGTISLALYSKVIGENPPIYIELAPNQWEQIIKAVRATGRPRKEAR